MNALLSLVISMGHNRLADALRFDRVDSNSDTSEEDENENENENDEEENEEEQETDEQTDNNNQDEPRSDSSDHPRDTSDSEDTRPPRPRKRPDRQSNMRHKRLKRPHSDDPDDPRLPPGCRVVFYKNKGETSTSNKEVQTSSEELADLSDPRSSGSGDDSAHGSIVSILYYLFYLLKLIFNPSRLYFTQPSYILRLCTTTLYVLIIFALYLLLLCF